jgi:hypothetical protein
MELCPRKIGRPNQFALVRRAKALGVTQGHLGRVLTGKREGRKLLARYSALLKSESRSQSTPTSTESPKTK